MSHQHDNECCGQLEQQHQHEHHEHQHAVMHNLGAICCQGTCSHPEHIAMQMEFEQLHQEQLRSATVATTETKPSKAKKKKVRGFSLSLLSIIQQHKEAVA